MIIKRIKNLLAILFFGNLLFNITSLQAITYGKSYFVGEPFFRPASVEEVAGTRDQLQVSATGGGGHHQFSIDPFGGASTDGDHIAEYFLPYAAHNRVHGSKKTLIVGELGSQAVNNGTVDLIAKYFGVLTYALPANNDQYFPSNYTFQSILTFAPQQTFWGFNFNYHCHFSHFLDKGFWCEISTPVTIITNNLNMTEEIVTAGGPNGNNPQVPAGYFGNMTDALKQNAYNYGKINGPCSRIGAGDLKLRLGYVYVNEQHYYLNTYMGLLAPLSGCPSNEFIFQPTIGSNGHFGFFSGASAAVRIWSRCERSIYWALDTAGTLLFSNHQLRSLDLQGRPWSRYLPVFLSEDTKVMSPGINFLTLPVQVDPDTVRDLNIAFIYKHEGLHAEFGYHFYARSVEKLHLLHSVGKTLAIATDIDGSVAPDFDYKDPANSVLDSKNAAAINSYLQVNNDQDLATGNFIYKPLTDADLDLTSAAHPGAISNVFYISVGSHLSNSNYPVFMGIGASYELGDDNTIVNKGMVWGKFNMSF